MSANKLPEYKQYLSAKEEALSKYSKSEHPALLKRFTDECIIPIGFNHEFRYIMDKSHTNEQKAENFLKWANLWKEGHFQPEKKALVSKVKKKTKRGASLDDLTLDEPKEPREEPDNFVTQPSKADEIMDQVCKEMPDKIEPKPKEETTMATTPKSKSKKEILMEAFKALEEDENTGITEEQVKKICVSVFCDLFKEVIDSIQSSSMALLNQIKMDEEES